jgi:isocitrate/isopropylmalate dehydrogenase
MIRFRRNLECFLKEAGIEWGHISHSRKNGFDIVIVREDGKDAMFFIHDQAESVEINIYTNAKGNRLELLEKINKLNLEYSQMTLCLKGDKIILRAWGKFDCAELYRIYQKGLGVLKSFE